MIRAYIKNSLLLCFLFAFVLIINRSIITFDMMYPEQPTIYTINQNIHHFSDLLKIYLHPVLLHADIAFFRPSGHFLIYQLLTPLIGWHNIKAFFVVSLLFLTGIGFFQIKLYKELFPGFYAGGFIAFSIYLMHPALSISRLTLMHFDFAYVFFLSAALYVFVKYCQSMLQSASQQGSSLLMLFALFLYAFAVTFKESAVMLGPAMIVYFLVSQYKGQQFGVYCYSMLANKNNWYVICLLMLSTILLGLYLLASWPGLNYASRNFNIFHTLGTINSFFQDVFGLQYEFIPIGKLAAPTLAWRTIIFPMVARLIIWGLCSAMLVCLGMIMWQASQIILQIRKSLFFLCISACFFLVLPFCWGMAGPWHYSLTILMISFVMGFSVEFLMSTFIKDAAWAKKLCYTAAFVIGCSGIIVNHANINKYQTLGDNDTLGLTLNKTAVFNPPAIKNQLNENSIIVVEDSSVHNDYIIGNSAYPFLLFMGEGDYEALEKKQQAYFVKYHHTFSGSLFRYAYLMPSLREENYPFQVEKMDDVPNEILYTWLQNYNNIFCVGYDKQANWHNKTRLFRENLKKEQLSRQLKVNAYQQIPVANMNRTTAYTNKLPYPDERLCQYTCDQDDKCNGFVYQNTTKNQHRVMQCQFYSASYSQSDKPCQNCLVFSKQSGLKRSV